MYQETIEPRLGALTTARLRAARRAKAVDAVTVACAPRGTAYAGALTAAVALALGFLTVWGLSLIHI